MNNQEYSSSTQPKLRGRLAEAFKEISALNARVGELSTENSELKFRIKEVGNELKDTRAILGQAFVNANKQPQEPDEALKGPRVLLEQFSVKANRLATPSSSARQNLTLKRSRSPSIEIIEKKISPPMKKKKKAKESTVIKVNPPVKKLRFTSVAYVSVPPLSKPSTSALESSMRNEAEKFHIQDYLASSAPLEINPPPLQPQVPRKFLWRAYGGNDRQFVQFIKADMNPSGPFRRKLVFPSIALNPLMPSRPGSPGLVYTPRHEILSNGPWTLFGKLSPGKTIWDYLGEYESEICGKMPASAFVEQPRGVKRGWAKSLMGSKGPELCRLMRARVVLRKAGAIPLTPRDEEAENDLVEAEVRAIKNGTGKEVSEQDIIEAFSRGDEAIDIIRMKCVKYDHVFANDIKAKLPNFEAMMLAASTQNAAVLSSQSASSSMPAKENQQRGSASKRRESIVRPILDGESEYEESEGESECEDSVPLAVRLAA